MIDYALVQLIPAEESLREFSYQVKKVAEGEYITQMFGWDENIQRGFHARAWQRRKPDIITYDGKPIGTIATIESQDCLEISQFFVLPSHQNEGIGTYLLKRVLDKADQLGLLSRLAFLRSNPVKSLYLRNGFRISSIDGGFCYMERRPKAPLSRVPLGGS